jgi:hypothetical protein
MEVEVGSTEEAPIPRLSYAQWVINSMGWPNLHILFLVTLLVAGLILYLARRGKGPAVSVAIVLLLPLPLLCGCLISVRAAIEWLMAVAISSPSANGLFTSNLWSRGILAMLLSGCLSVPLLIQGITVLIWPELFRSRPSVKESVHG